MRLSAHKLLKDRAEMLSGELHSHKDAYSSGDVSTRTLAPVDKISSLYCIHRWSVTLLRFYELMRCSWWVSRCFILSSHNCPLCRENLSWYSSQDRLAQMSGQNDQSNKLLWPGHIVEITHPLCLLSSSHSCTLPSASPPLCCYHPDLGLLAGYLSSGIPKGRFLHVFTLRFTLTAHLSLWKNCGFRDNEGLRGEAKWKLMTELGKKNGKKVTLV